MAGPAMLEAAEWTLRFDDSSWNDNVAFDHTTLRYKSVRLLNCYAPANLVHICSGGSTTYINDPSKKLAIRFTAQASKNVNTLGLNPSYPSNPPLLRVGIQESVNGVPDGNYLGSGTWLPGGDEVWGFITVTPEIQLTEGKEYWVVVEYDSGTCDATHYVRLYASLALSPFGNDNSPLPYNEGYDKNVNDRFTTTIKYFNGSQWLPEPNNRLLGTFILSFTDGTHAGTAYQHTYFSPNPGLEGGEILVIHNQNKTINQIGSPWNIWDDLKYTYKPNAPILFKIRQNDQNGPVLRSGVFLNPENAGYKRQWYYVPIAPPLTLVKDAQYFASFSSQNTDSNGSWQSDAPNAMHQSEAGVPLEPWKSCTFDTDASYFRRIEKTSSGTSVKNDRNRDLSFTLKLKDVFTGNFHSVAKDSEAAGAIGEVWKAIQFDGDLPAGTTAGIFVNVSFDNAIWSDWIPVMENSAANRIYELPEVCRQRFAQWKITLNTTAVSESPDIRSVTFMTGSKSLRNAPKVAKVFPNPYTYHANNPGRIVFADLPLRAVIRIYTLAGNCVATIQHASVEGGFNVWDVSRVSSGVYLYTIDSTDRKESGKLSIIK